MKSMLGELTLCLTLTQVQAHLPDHLCAEPLLRGLRHGHETGAGTRPVHQLRSHSILSHHALPSKARKAKDAPPALWLSHSTRCAEFALQLPSSGAGQSLVLRYAPRPFQTRATGSLLRSTFRQARHSANTVGVCYRCCRRISWKIAII